MQGREGVELVSSKEGRRSSRSGPGESEGGRQSDLELGHEHGPVLLGDDLLSLDHRKQKKKRERGEGGRRTR